MLKSLKSGERKELFAGDAARYIPTGHIIYEVGNNLLAVPFDLKTLKVTGGQVPVVEGVLGLPTPQYAVSYSGTLVYVPGTGIDAATLRTLVLVDRNGKEEPLEAPLNAYSNPRISPDGTRVALSVRSGNGADIWIWDLVHKALTRLTFEGGAVPLWTPDGKRIAFFSWQEGQTSLYWKAANGSGKDEFLCCSTPGFPGFPTTWSDSGKNLVVTEWKLGSPESG